MWSVGMMNIIKNSNKVNFRQIDVTMLAIISAGSVIIKWRLAFERKIVLTEIGCAFKNQMLFPSSEIEGAEINIVELEKQKISAKIPERS